MRHLLVRSSVTFPTLAGQSQLAGAVETIIQSWAGLGSSGQSRTPCVGFNDRAVAANCQRAQAASLATCRRTGTARTFSSYIQRPRCAFERRGAQRFSSGPHWQGRIVEILFQRADLSCAARYLIVHAMRSAESSAIRCRKRILNVTIRYREKPGKAAVKPKLPISSYDLKVPVIPDPIQRRRPFLPSSPQGLPASP